MSVAAVLPPAGAPFEVALAAAMTDELPVPIAEIVDPARTPAAFLPFLAVHDSVDLWFSDWPEARKRQMISEAPVLASLKGTRAAAARFLPYVDAQIVHKVSHPARYPVGRIATRLTPINHKAFVARYLIKVTLVAPKRAICVGRTAVGRAALRQVSREPIRRAKVALVVSKAPETAYSVSFAHRVRITLDDGIDLDSGYRLGDFRDRTRL